ncbi:MAG: hypothetical protein EZS28_043240 [Streblomastix strix]|uniref:Uncharacterized protein n=1 Tax=Streblomastix strix TaxID=222440 RepID=A0A5J4TTI7_9EUKA|nr:MAG: hypothetical protein EZS28_043240 [Streblomastix strix]
MIFDSGSHKSRHSTVGIVVSPSENLQPLPVAIEENIRTTTEYASFLSRTICGLHLKGFIVPSVTIDGLSAYLKVLQPGNDNEHVSFQLLKAGINVIPIVKFLGPQEQQNSWSKMTRSCGDSMVIYRTCN